MVDVLYERTGVEANSFGKYRLIAGLGRGGMATVHLAVMHGPAGFNKLVVLKQIHPEYADDPEILGMFLDEAQLAARLSHPNVVQTNEVGQEGDRRFLAMEYLDGQPLSRINRRLERHGGLPLVLHLRIIADLLSGLHYAHELTDYNGSPLGVVHRDVTPQNIFVTYDGIVKIVDFGIAKAQNALIQTRVGIIKGKIAYMPPEQARGEPVDRRADIFAVGVMLWEAATGKRPWEGMPELAVMKRLLNGELPTPRSVRPDVSPALEAIILKATSHERRDRYATAAELQVALEAFIATSGERLQQRELSLLISHHFARERAKIKAVIEEQLRVIPSAALALPVILDESTGAGDDAAAEELRAAGESSSLGANSLRTRPTAPTSPHAAAAKASPRITAGRLGGAAFVGAALLAASGLSLRWGPTKVEAAGAPAAVPSRSDVAPLAAPRSTTVQLRISATPADARLFLDDALLAGNPWKGELARDELNHRIRIEAPGFIDRVEAVTLDDDRAFTIVLIAEPLSPGGTYPRPGSGLPRPPGKKRPLDVANPYAP
jgi:serine/threonine-protein kinase